MSESSSPLRRDDVAKVARLARLTLSDAELDLFTTQLSQVLEHANDMNALDLADLEPTAHPFGLTNVFRDDVIRPSLEPESFLSQAPDAEGGRFGVPRILGEAP
jgi:aspartyl-tRNA(Asn)/glutamyl-tRNA(Gln) amidotransferase subunit C